MRMPSETVVGDSELRWLIGIALSETEDERLTAQQFQSSGPSLAGISPNRECYINPAFDLYAAQDLKAKSVFSLKALQLVEGVLLSPIHC
jgi:hypothetical protein